MNIRTAIAAMAIGATLGGGATAPALADSSDCRIMGPEYVAEVVDCAIYIYTTAIG